MTIKASQSISIRSNSPGLWGVIAVVLLSIIYLMSQSGIDHLKIATVIAMLLTAVMLFNKSSRLFLILPAVLALAFSLLAFSVHLFP
ncbi:DUF1435 family protein [Moellerella wisconsensis]|uniref:DUF1435 domain-containing protein n=1 Tax=Moellerella wisconsensis TaxID=158849 RepID=A0ACD3Y6A3_9GAMM|nr:DUF1435 family protein [Moellerella wisconsensis]KLN97803.1 MFS transporter [Moellerella wisconsensis]UNH23779.1 DUF1435 domain-containing protein [Moellerella wisconsensis]UNH38510.1 DUF1435 domain-containing protein [Moellerella wisconsensis]